MCSRVGSRLPLSASEGIECKEPASAPTPQPDLRSEVRAALDEQIGSEPHLRYLDVASGEQPRPLEEHLRERHRSAIVGVVEKRLRDSSSQSLLY
jgi:hypothetical protein